MDSVLESSPARQRDRLEGLNGLRAIACLAVFAVHVQQTLEIESDWGPFELGRLLENGNIGVCLFFLLSGFLISIPFWTGTLAATKRSWLLPYAIRRVARILPAFYLCLTVLAFCQGAWRSLSGVLNTACHYLLVHNYVETYFYGISSPFWTVAIQAQFYVCLAVLFWALGRITRSTTVWALVISGIMVSAYMSHYFLMACGDAICERIGLPLLIAQHPTVVSHSVLAHLPHLLLGVLAGGLYLWLKRFLFWERWATLAFCLSAITVLLIISTKLDDFFQIPFGRYNLPVIPVLIAIMLVSAPLSSRVSRFLEFVPLRWLGQISFGVYVYHLSCLRVVERGMTHLGPNAREHCFLFVAAGLVLTLLIASASYVLVEQPLMAATRHRIPAPSPNGQTDGS